VPRYQGREGYWAWVLHRVSGLGVLLFLLMHIVDTSFMLLGREVYDHAIELYRQPLFRVGEVFIFAGVLYHALNGLRIIVIDFWDGAFRIQRQLWYGVLALSLGLMVPIAWVMLRPVFARA
jgi:succinate dehydrogenase cytochrome b subunit